LTARSDFTQILKDFGVGGEQPLLLEAPWLQAETIEGGFQAFTVALQGFLASGLLVVPTCTASEGKPKPTFDPALSPSEAGPFSEFFRKQPGVIRSHSPTHSLTAMGTEAQALLAGHRSASGRPSPWGDGAFGKSSPWDLLHERNAWWILVDEAWSESVFFDYLSAVYTARNSGITKTAPFVHFDPSALVRHFRTNGLLKESQWGNHTIVGFRVREVLDSALTLMESRPFALRPDRETSNWLAMVNRIKQDGYLQVGVSRQVITPPVPCLRWDGKPLQAVYRDLCCRVIVASHKDSTVALVLCDLLGLRRDLTEQIRIRAGRMTGISQEAIQIACTHAHSTPDTAAAGFEDPSYLEMLVQTVATAISAAATNRQPARMGSSRVPIRGLAASRRVRLKDGKVFTTRYGVPSTWRVNPELIAGSGRIDPDLTVVRFETLEGKALAVVSNFGCHPSVALASHFVSGDFIGESMAALEQLFGEPAVVLCTNGGGADVDPTLEMPFWGPRDEAWALRLGNIFAAQVLECLERTPVTDTPALGAAKRLVDLPIRPEWIRLLREERERMEQEFAGATLSPAMLSLLAQQVMHTEVQALRLGDLTLVGLPGEVFAGTALKLKSKFLPHNLAVVQLANDDIGYLAPKEAFEEGGYEVGVHFWGRITPEGESILVAEALAAVTELAGVELQAP